MQQLGELICVKKLRGLPCKAEEEELRRKKQRQKELEGLELWEWDKKPGIVAKHQHQQPAQGKRQSRAPQLYRPGQENAGPTEHGPAWRQQKQVGQGCPI